MCVKNVFQSGVVKNNIKAINQVWWQGAGKIKREVGNGRVIICPTFASIIAYIVR
ncbi:MAG TPA: hypothetical protein PLD25_07565 [Chloroflexota bacterium]|nr:hypothetical protein [Chloroflexota bacterium]